MLQFSLVSARARDGVPQANHLPVLDHRRDALAQFLKLLAQLVSVRSAADDSVPLERLQRLSTDGKAARQDALALALASSVQTLTLGSAHSTTPTRNPADAPSIAATTNHDGNGGSASKVTRA